MPRSYLEIEGLADQGRQAESQGFMGAPLLQVSSVLGK